MGGGGGGGGQFVLEIDALRELKKQDKLTQEKAKRLAELEKNYYDRNDGHEFILVLPDGRLIRYVFIWSQKDQDERIQRFILRAADAELQEHAISTDGAVVFNRIAADGTVGQVIPDKAGHKFRIGMAEADKVLDWIGTLSPQRQTEIFLRKFVSFEYELNGQKVLATLTFPRDVDVTREWTNPWTGEFWSSPQGSDISSGAVCSSYSKGTLCKRSGQRGLSGSIKLAK